MTDFEKIFSPQEYSSRLRDVKQRMVRAGFDLIICQDPSNMYWLTGFDGWCLFMSPNAFWYILRKMPLSGLVAHRMPKRQRSRPIFQRRTSFRIRRFWFRIRMVTPTKSLRSSSMHEAGVARGSVWKWMPITIPPVAIRL